MSGLNNAGKPGRKMGGYRSARQDWMGKTPDGVYLVVRDKFFEYIETRGGVVIAAGAYLSEWKHRLTAALWQRVRKLRGTAERVELE